MIVGDPGVQGMENGIYQYVPDEHRVDRIRAGDYQSDLRGAALDQEWVGAAAIDIVVCAVDERTTQRYGERGRRRYVPMEAGHVGENLYLQAEALGFATVSVGAFDDERVRDLLGVSVDRRPLSIYPVGKRP